MSGWNCLLPARIACDMAVGHAPDKITGPVRRAELLVSFAVLPLCLIIGGLLRLYDLRSGAVTLPPGISTGHMLAVHALLLTLAWLGYLALSYELAGVAERRAQWPRFVMVINWVFLIQYVMTAISYVPQLLHGPSLLIQLAQLCFSGWALWIEWFATRNTLALSGLAAAGLVALDTMLSLGLVAMAPG
ncbi:Hypothetical protein GbCGDNIH1_0689 [Granulibacter bethesdensis CGDNIH1]|uniref:Uncharacterized protein n=2 Tax=Granulibacter bethesdensis TaxID=364410 RepID=Q0BUB5_GRABC|nr:Hypothetical protein GbCGDNIH1_0689 [Granulibacter bethesdensis CGDNIH1]APH51388.1 Hypothetical protein GbCGDNIH5_0689 [Granulibacter bethesdensis]APH64081.1 Hypothetical protein GbCGDNIH1I4_0689 [Granulibacter bethesdensis]